MCEYCLILMTEFNGQSLAIPIPERGSQAFLLPPTPRAQQLLSPGHQQGASQQEIDERMEGTGCE